MGQFDDMMNVPEGETALVRLFPLPNLVLFPHVLQPLHIFEPRYCQMLEDALGADRLIATVLLEPGWEQDYEGRPPVHSTVCVGRVVSHSCEGEARHNILLLGVRRARILDELPMEREYRQAEVLWLGDHYPSEPAGQRQQLRRGLITNFRSYLPTSQGVQEQFEQLLNSQVPLGVLTDIVAFTMNLDLRVKQQLLEQLNVDRRAGTLLKQLQALKEDQQAPARRFPPEFSLN